jgi:hypothetical protein
MLGGDEYRLAQLAPADTTIFLEAQDLRGSLEAFRSSDAFGDYTDSKTGEKIAEGWGQLVKAVDASSWKETGLTFDEDVVLDLIGKNIAIGAIAPVEGDPSVFAMTRLDLLNLAQKAAVEGDWTKLWEKFQKAIGGDKVKLEPYKGYDIATRSSPGGDLHFAMLQDTIVFSPQHDTVKRTIDVHVGDEPSLASRKAFDNEIDELPVGKTAYGWVDMAFLRDSARVKQTVDKLGELLGAKDAQKFKGDELAVLIDDLQELDGLALAAVVPDGDLYRASVAASRSADDTFKDNKRYDLRELVSSDTIFYFEARGLYGVLEGFLESDTLATLLDTEAAQWLKHKLENPEELEALAALGAPKLDKNATFEARLALAALRIPLRELLGNDLAIAIEATDAKELTEAVRPLMFVHTRPALRIVADLFTGVVATHANESKELTVASYGGRTIYTFAGPVPIHWTRVGGELALSSQKEQVQRVIDRAVGNDVGVVLQSEDFNKAVTRLPEGYRLFG